MYVAFLLHMHQPCYKDAVSGSHVMPWVRLHGLKDYYDVVQRMEDFPRFRCNVNVVPSLLVQLDELQESGVDDRFLDLAAKSADDLTQEDRAFLLQHFFALNWEHMLQPHARYVELLQKRRGAARGDATWDTRQFSTQDYRDLQVWFLLAWSGDALRQDPAVVRLLARGRIFSEADKRDLLEVQRVFLGRIIPLYQRLHREGRIELSCSPLHHPILPLLSDIRSARVAQPDLPLPQMLFRAPEDALEQIVKARRYMVSRLGIECGGMWPSEGAISPQAVEQMRKAGVGWTASDAIVLQRSLADGRTDTHFRPYLSGDDESAVAIFFRDRELSDLIGFSYSRWRGRDAASDLIERLLKIAGRHGSDAIVSIILDGENAWEHYPDNGREFWLSFLQSISECPDLQPVTFADYLKEHPPLSVLPRLHSGSWIYGDFRTWVGHHEKNRGWELLAQTRAAVAARTTPDSHPLVWDCIFAAEGSDWFWWYGDDHPTYHRAEFDALFRAQLQKAYLELELQVPEVLHQAISERTALQTVESPLNPVSPVLDGKVTDFFEWLGSGRIAAAAAAGSMHAGASVLKQVFFGLNHEFLFFRLDPLDPGFNVAAWTIGIVFQRPAGRRIEVDRAPAGLTAWIVEGDERKPLYSVAAGRVIEIAVPLASLALTPDSEVEWFVQVSMERRPVERWPRGEAVSWSLWAGTEQGTELI